MIPLGPLLGTMVTLLGLGACSKASEEDLGELAHAPVLSNDSRGQVSVEAFPTGTPNDSSPAYFPAFPRINRTGDRVFFERLEINPLGRVAKDFFMASPPQGLELVTSNPKGYPSFFRFEEAPIGAPARQGFDTAMDDSGDKLAFEAFHSHFETPPDAMHTNIFFRESTNRPAVQITRSLAGAEPNGHSVLPNMSADGGCLAFVSGASNLLEGDGNGKSDAFVQSLDTGKFAMLRDGASEAGAEGDALAVALSGDCQYAATYFQMEDRANLVLFHLPGSGRILEFQSKLQESGTPLKLLYYGGQLALSEDGRFLAFVAGVSEPSASEPSQATQIYLYDRRLDQIERISQSADGSPGDADSVTPSLSADGRFVAFDSRASNLVAEDRNGKSDIFVFDRQNRRMRRASVGLHEEEGSESSSMPRISGNGAYVVFVSGNRGHFPAWSSGEGFSGFPQAGLFRVGLDYFFKD